MEVTKARQEAISEIVSAEAELFPYRQASLSPKISSPVKRYFVNRGDHVRAGQLLAVLENHDLVAGVKQAEGAYDQAQASYATTVSATIPQELQKAQSDVQDAKSNLDAQQKLYDNRKALYAQGAMAGKELDQSRVALIAAQSQTRTAEKHLKDLSATVARETTKSAQGQLDAASGQKAAAAAQLQYSQLRSPITGVVAYRNLYPGDIAPAGTPLITVMDVSRIIAKLHIPHAKAALLKIGDPATLTLGGIDQRFSGRVTILSPALDPNSTTSEIWVEIPNSDSKLEPGSSAHVAVISRTVKDAVVIPASAIITDDQGAPAVMVVSADYSAHRQQVREGIRDGDKVQIVSGVAPGQRIISSGAYGLPDGTKVQLAPNNPPQSKAIQP